MSTRATPPVRSRRRRSPTTSSIGSRTWPGVSRRIGVVGLLNLQLAVKDEKIWVLEANPRASRTVPFMSKVIGVSLAGRDLVLAGRTLAELAADDVLPADAGHYRRLPFTAMKAAVLPFGRFPGVDTVLGPEMRSTGEVMGIDAIRRRARQGDGRRRARAPDVGNRLRERREPRQARDRLPAKRLSDLGFALLATTGTAGSPRAGIPVEAVAKVSEAPRTDAERGTRNVAELIGPGGSTS